MSISIKLMGVPGPKLMEEERHTQDFTGVSTPTFVTPDTKANAHLQKWSVKNAQIFHFLNLTRPHVARPHHAGPVDQDAEQPVRSARTSAACRTCWARARPCSTRSGRRPRRGRRFRGCRCARPTTTCATRWWRRSPAATCALDFRVQVQTDPHLMPIENNGVLWPERLSPRVSVATLRLPRAALRLAGADRVRAPAVVQPVALHPRAPPARQPEPGAAPDVLRAVAAPPPHERRSALRAHRGRDVRVGRAMTPQSQVYVTAPITPGQRGRAAAPARLDDRACRARPGPDNPALPLRRVRRRALRAAG